MLAGIALLGAWWANKSWFSNEDDSGFIGPIPPVPPDPSPGLTIDKWDDALFGLAFVGLILFSKPWKK